MPAEQPSVRGNNIKPAEVEPSALLDLPSYSSNADAPDGSLFWHTGSSEMRYKNAAGSVFSSGGLADGENFDGQGTSSFTNLSDIDVSTATIDGDPGAGFGNSTSATPSFDTWNQISADRPSFLIVYVLAETDGTNIGQVELLIDENGDDTATYRDLIVEANDKAGASYSSVGKQTAYIPAGGQYRLRNKQDPNNNNDIRTVREVEL